ncbi:MAG: hypothetical protein OXQ90_03865 [Gammaproteobacteria bacterium]|nr:hypothetical protein [Gammaproteobacteria bacterium]
MVELHVTKLEAARRQLREAIRMFFADADVLAVHTVASAAYRLISDLKSQRGRDEVGDFYLTATFYAVRDYHRGTLPGYLTDNPETMRWIRDLAATLPITATSEYEDVNVEVSPDVARGFWKQRNKVYNFLKHADNDANRHISLDEVDNLFLLMLACGSYSDLTVGNVGAEGYALWLYWQVHSGTTEHMPRDFLENVEHLSSSELLSFFGEFMTELKREWGET